MSSDTYYMYRELRLFRFPRGKRSPMGEPSSCPLLTKYRDYRLAPDTFKSTHPYRAFSGKAPFRVLLVVINQNLVDGLCDILCVAKGVLLSPGNIQHTSTGLYRIRAHI